MGWLFVIGMLDREFVIEMRTRFNYLYVRVINKN